jgi:hypothetical protein
MINETDIDAMKPDFITPEKALIEFIRSFGASLDPRLWLKLVDEELSELYAEKPKTVAHLKEYTDLLYVYTGLSLTIPEGLSQLVTEEERLEFGGLAQRAERALNEYFVEYGEYAVATAFYRVHESNMSKLGEDGKPIKREDGKILKGPNYKEPDLTDLLNKKEEKENE